MRWGRYALILLPMMMGSVACTHVPKPGVYDNVRRPLEKGDDFNWLLMRAGVEPEDMPSSQEITVQQAQDLRAWIQFMLQDGHMASYGPRKTVEFLMEEIIAGGVPVARSTLCQQLSRFQDRFVLRPDAYVADALRGKPLRSVGPLRVVRGAVMAANLKLGAFYVQDGSSLREDSALVIHPPRSNATKLSTAQR